MSASDKLNEITKIRRGQGYKARADYVESVHAVKGNKLRFCGSWLYLREFLQSGETKVVNALLCKLPFLCEVCAVRKQAKMFAASVPKVKHVLAERPNLIPALITYGIKTGPDLAQQFEHFTSSRSRMLAARRRSESVSCRNGRRLEISKIVGEIRCFEVKRAKGDSEHWNVHQHSFVLLSDLIDQQKFSDEWREFTGDSFIVDVRRVHPKNSEADPVESGLLEVIKYPMKFSGLRPEDAWHAHETLGGRHLHACLGALRGIRPGSLETDDGIDQPGPFRDFIAQWVWQREAFALSEVQRFSDGAAVNGLRPDAAPGGM